jgi:ABC-type Mn2+/Zn2+ transport system ATPase subunit
LKNFELPISRQSSVLLIGKNGSGKTTLGLALEVLQKVHDRVSSLVKPKDLLRGLADVPMRFEIEVALNSKLYEYAIAFELPEGFKELRVLEERLVVDSQTVYTRKDARVVLAKRNP